MILVVHDYGFFMLKIFRVTDTAFERPQSIARLVDIPLTFIANYCLFGDR